MRHTLDILRWAVLLAILFDEPVISECNQHGECLVCGQSTVGGTVSKLRSVIYSPWNSLVCAVSVFSTRPSISSLVIPSSLKRIRSTCARVLGYRAISRKCMNDVSPFLRRDITLWVVDTEIGS